MLGKTIKCQWETSNGAKRVSKPDSSLHYGLLPEGGAAIVGLNSLDITWLQCK